MGTQPFLKCVRDWPGTSDKFERIGPLGFLVRCHHGADDNEEPSVIVMDDAWTDYADYYDALAKNASDDPLSAPQKMTYFELYLIGKFGEHLGLLASFSFIFTGV